MARPFCVKFVPIHKGLFLLCCCAGMRLYWRKLAQRTWQTLLPWGACTAVVWTVMGDQSSCLWERTSRPKTRICRGYAQIYIISCFPSTGEHEFMSSRDFEIFLKTLVSREKIKTLRLDINSCSPLNWKQHFCPTSQPFNVNKQTRLPLWGVFLLQCIAFLPH